MTDQELKDLVARLAVTQDRTDQQLAETQKQFTETQKQFTETQKQFTETQKQAAEAQKQFTEAQKQAAEAQKRSAESQARLDQEFAKTNQQMRETERFIKEVARQIGDLGNKFGSFTEGMAWPSMQKLMREKFKMDTIGPRVIKRRNGRTMELDVLAYVNGETNAACVVEVKSHLRADGVKQMLQTMREFTHFFPEHRGKKVYGILAVVDAPENVKKQALDAGLYLARIHDENFTLDVPVDFRARDFGQMNGAAS